MNFLILILYNETKLYKSMYELLVKHYNKYNSVKFHFIELMEYEFPVTDVIAFNDYHRLIFRGSDSLYPGCMDKTIKGLEYERENIYNGKYDYIIRTNISSIINIKLLADNINSLPVKYDYMGSIENLYRYGNIVPNDELASKHYASGTMIVMNPHFAKLIMNNKQFFSDNNYYDDFIIGVFANKFAAAYNITMNFTTFKHMVNNPGYDPNIVLYRNRSGNESDSDRTIDVKNMAKIIEAF